MGDFFLAFGVALLAELGDKSQLAAVAFGARHRFLPVLTGFAIGSLVTLGLAVLLGAWLGELLPADVRSYIAGGLFTVFAVWTLLSHDEDEPEVRAVQTGLLVVGVAVAVVMAELGDKTMFATAALASRQSAVPTWLGASAGMITASTVAMGIGAFLGPRLPQRMLRRGGAAVFAAVAVGLVVSGLRA